MRAQRGQERHQKEAEAATLRDQQEQQTQTQSGRVSRKNPRYANGVSKATRGKATRGGGGGGVAHKAVAQKEAEEQEAADADREFDNAHPRAAEMAAIQTAVESNDMDMLA